MIVPAGGGSTGFSEVYIVYIKDKAVHEYEKLVCTFKMVPYFRSSYLSSSVKWRFGENAYKAITDEPHGGSNIWITFDPE